MRYAECRYAECRYAECRYDECRYAECRYAECRGYSVDNDQFTHFFTNLSQFDFAIKRNNLFKECSQPGLPSNIRLGWKGLPGARLQVQKKMMCCEYGP